MTAARDSAAAGPSVRFSRGGKLATASEEMEPAQAAPPAEPRSTIMQARVPAEYAAQLAADAEVLGLVDPTRTGIVRAALRLLHREAREARMSADVQNFYRDKPIPPLLTADLSEGDDLNAVLTTPTGGSVGGAVRSE